MFQTRLNPRIHAVSITRPPLTIILDVAIILIVSFC